MYGCVDPTNDDPLNYVSAKSLLEIILVKCCDRHLYGICQVNMRTEDVSFRDRSVKCNEFKHWLSTEFGAPTNVRNHRIHMNRSAFAKAFAAATRVHFNELHIHACKSGRSQAYG